jgi:sec-independent protein translocase protein TatC
MKHQAEMTLLEHLQELRWRLSVATVVTVSISIAMGLCSAPVVRALSEPLTACGSTIILETESPTEFLGVLARASLATGFVLAWPMWLYQMLRFAAPGLEPHELRYALMTSLTATLLFALGATVGLFMGLPSALKMLYHLGHSTISHSWQLKAYVKFTTRFLLAAGLIPEIPLIANLLKRLGISSRRLPGRLAIATAGIAGVLFADFLAALGGIFSALIILLGFILLGPKRLVSLAHVIARVIGQARKVRDQFFAEIQTEMQGTASD